MITKTLVKKVLLLSLLLGLVAPLGACGGGGGEAPAPEATPTQTP